MSDHLKLLLREKYSLGHVPSRHTVARWVALTRSHMQTGQPAEQAGLLAAHKAFACEARDYALYSAMPMEELLLHADPDG
ncbi:MAG: hypothetical protein ACOCW3_02445 [Spirochaetota bacterium]